MWLRRLNLDLGPVAARARRRGPALRHLDGAADLGRWRALSGGARPLIRTAGQPRGMARKLDGWTGSGLLRLLGYQLEAIGQSAELRERAQVHLAHRPAAVDLHGGLGDADIAGNLLAEAATRDLNYDFALAWAQRLEALLDVGQRKVVVAPGTIATEAELNGVEKILIAERLRQELDGAA